MRFHFHGQAGHGQVDLIGLGGNHLVQFARRIAKGAGKRVLGHDTATDLIRHQHHRIMLPPKCRNQIHASRTPVGPVKHQIAQPQRQTVDQPRPLPITAIKRSGQIKWRRQRDPFRAAPRLMAGHTGSHFVIMDFCRGDIGRTRRKTQRFRFGQGAFARPGAAGDQYRLAHGDRRKQKRTAEESGIATMAPMQTTELVLIRHAPAKSGGRIYGRLDLDADCSDQTASAALRAHLPQPARILASPARRCLQTLQTIWPDTKADTDAALWEQNLGDWEGRPARTLPDLGPLSRAELARHRPPGGESFEDLAARVIPVISGLAETQGPVAVVAHAGTIRATLGWALGAIPAALAFEIAPWSCTRIALLSDGTALIREVNTCG